MIRSASRFAHHLRGAFLALLTAVLLVVLLVHCSNPAPMAEGGGTRGGNPVVTGKLFNSNGFAAPHVQVLLLNATYNPLTQEAQQPIYTDTTNARGEYSFELADTGYYTIEALNSNDGTRSIRFNIKPRADTTIELPADTLHQPGSISVIVPGGTDTGAGYVYIPGSAFSSSFTGNRDTVRIDSVPIGIVPELTYVVLASDKKSTIGTDVPVISGETTLIMHTQLPNRQTITLNTTPTGAAVAEDVPRFPVLIRLTKSNFDFTTTNKNGSSLMFTGRGNTQLPFAIERWDSVAQKAEVWVTVDTVYGNNAEQSIMLFWGNAVSVPEEKGKNVFDTANSFQGVWHLGDAPTVPFADATDNHFNGSADDTTRPQQTTGIIGNCSQFDGKNDCITMQNTASGKLNFVENGTYTVYAWVAIDSFDNASHCILSKGYEQYYLRSTYISTTLPAGEPLWEFVEFGETSKWQATNTKAENGTWSLLVAVRDGPKQILYCNGVAADSTVDSWYNIVSRSTVNNLMLGRFAQLVTVPVSEGYCHFKGKIDEVRILNAAKSAAWIRLCYMNQRTDDRLVEFR